MNVKTKIYERGIHNIRYIVVREDIQDIDKALNLYEEIIGIKINTSNKMLTIIENNIEETKNTITTAAIFINSKHKNINKEQINILNKASYNFAYSGINKHICTLIAVIINYKKEMDEEDERRYHNNIYADFIFKIKKNDNDTKFIVFATGIPYNRLYDHNYMLNGIYDDIDKVSDMCFNAGYIRYPYIYQITYMPYTYAYCMLSHLTITKHNKPRRVKFSIYSTWHNVLADGKLNINERSNKHILEHIGTNNLVYNENPIIHIPAIYIRPEAYSKYFPIYGFEVEGNKIIIYVDLNIKQKTSDLVAGNKYIIADIVNLHIQDKPIITYINPYTNNKIINTTLWIKH